MSKHTPGPWDIYFNAQDDLVIRKMFPDGQESHVVAHCHSGFDNARLIAAAPDLLDALKSLLWYVGQLEMLVYSADDAGEHEEVAKASAAMLKARGNK
jgi:hypothetical protein